MGMLIKKIRVKGFRGLENIEIDLEKTTILTGVNNSGKTSVLCALQLVFGSHQFISQEDFFIKGNMRSNEIIIDTLIIPVDANNQRCKSFNEGLERLFTFDRIRMDQDERFFVSFRTEIKFDPVSKRFKKEQFSIEKWPRFQERKENIINWFDHLNGKKMSFYYPDYIPFFYLGEQRDIIEDIKQKNSYLGKIISSVVYSDKDIERIEKQLESLNNEAIQSSVVLSKLKETMSELHSAMNIKGVIDITPFTKKLRDLNKGLSIYYMEHDDSFSMEYHGMGTRSWSSLLSLKAFISLISTHLKKEGEPFYPIVAIEEPEAHLHSNAQKRLYSQIDTIDGQKIISTHSPYLASRAQIDQLRNLYKGQKVECGFIQGNDLSDEDIEKIKTHVLSTRGEIIFSKCIIFMEGQTERETLPIFAEEFFKEHSLDILEINFIDVGGKNYSPFLKFATGFGIPWIIFSDSEEKTIEHVQKQVSSLSIIDAEDRIIFLDNGNNFEQQLINDGFVGEIKEAYKSLQRYENSQHKIKKEKKIDAYDKNVLLEIMKNNKIDLGKATARKIIESNKGIPKVVKKLFNKIVETLHLSQRRK